MRTSVFVIDAGESLTIGAVWTGVRETDGYNRIGVIYPADGSAL